MQGKKARVREAGIGKESRKLEIIKILNREKTTRRLILMSESFSREHMKEKK